MIDKSAEAAGDPNYLLTLEDIQAWENEHGALPDGGWLFLRTGWDARAHDQAAFLNGGETPGPDVDAARYLAERAPIVGFGCETVGTDAGLAHSFDPAFPVHHLLLGAASTASRSSRTSPELPPTARSRSSRRSSSSTARDPRAACSRLSEQPLAQRSRVEAVLREPAGRAAVALVEDFEHALEVLGAACAGRRRCLPGRAGRSPTRAGGP